MAYSATLKHRVIIHYKYFLHSIRKVAKYYNVSKTTVGRWIKSDNIAITIKRKRVKKIHQVSSFVKSHIISNPFTTLLEMSLLIEKEMNIKISTSTCSRILKTCGFTKKKTKPCISRPTKNKEIVDLFLEKVSKTDKPIIALDETYFHKHDCPKYGYSLKGQPLKHIFNENPRIKKITMYAAISKDKIVGYSLMKENGNTTSFLAFLESLNVTNSIILMDNVAFHKSSVIKDYLTRSNNEALFIPPYSPEYNPIELMFSKIKVIYRKQSVLQKCTMEENIESSIKTISLNDLSNYYKHSFNLI